MAVNLQGIRRNIKNVAHNYTDAQVKVREATSNDPWGPSSTMMSEIADLTYDVAAFSEIMQMVWKRLNDHGKNWRHVYKALVLLEYLIKTGSEKVAQQCKENIYAIQTLKDFQYLDDNKDQGINVREKAKAVVALLKDDDRLKNERVRALKAKERFAQAAAGIGSDTVYNGVRERYDGQQRQRGGGGEGGMGGGGSGGSPTSFEIPPSELEAARPQTVGEEGLQLQLALAMSREEAEQEETKNKSDDVGLQLALQKSKEVAKDDDKKGAEKSKPSSDLLDLVDINFGNPNAVPPPAQPTPPQRTAASTIDPWGMPAPSGAAAKPVADNDPWRAPPSPPPAGPVPPPVQQQQNDPWAAIQQPPSSSRLGGGGSPYKNSAAFGETPALTSSSIPAYNDPWNPVGAASGAAAAAAKPDSFSPPLRSTNSPAAAVTAAVAAVADNDPWMPAAAARSETHQPAAAAAPQSVDPFSPVAQNQLAEFDLLRDQMETKAIEPSSNNGGSTSPNPFDLGGLTSTLESNGNSANGSGLLLQQQQPSGLVMATGTKPKKQGGGGVQSLLGEHSNLVNLDELVSSGKPAVRNPFEQQPPNPFQAAKAPKPAMNDLLQQKSGQVGWHTQPTQQQQQQPDANPFFDTWN